MSTQATTTTGRSRARRSDAGAVRCSERDIELLREVADLTASGIGLEGVRRILELEHQVAALRGRNSELRGQVAELHGGGENVVLVTSGAIARGMRLLELDQRPSAIDEMQAASAVGQAGYHMADTAEAG